MRTTPTLLALTGFALICWADVARADGPTTVDTQRADDTRGHEIDRTWLYVDDARVPDPWVVVGMTSLSYTSVGSDPGRIDAPYKPFAGNTAQPGAMLSLGGEVGLLPRLSIVALGQMGAGGETSGLTGGAIAGVRLQLSPPSWRNVRVLVSGGYLREAWSSPIYNDDSNTWTPGSPNGDNAAWAEAAVAADFGRAHVGLTGHGEHVFAEGRDAVDVMLRAGASYEVVGPLRAGVEWVGQDLEESFSSGAEAGARQFVGPTAAIQLLQNRLTLVGGPSFGLSAQSPRVLGRVALAYGF
jgi:hypothetical protein